MGRRSSARAKTGSRKLDCWYLGFEIFFARYIFNDESGRLIDPPPKEIWELHGLVDTGKLAWGRAIYLRYPLPNGEFFAALIFSTTRVAPTKKYLSVPRKELNSIVLGEKHLLEIASELAVNVSKRTIHSDSLICLYWLQKSSKDLVV